MELFDGKTGHQKTVDLSGQGKRTSKHYRISQSEMTLLSGDVREGLVCLYCCLFLMLGLRRPVLTSFSESQPFWKPVLFLGSV